MPIKRGKKPLNLREKILASGEQLWETRMRQFCEAFERGEIPDPELVEFTTTAFRLILAGEDPKKAFGVVRKSGRKRDPKDQARYWKIAYAVEKKIQAGSRRWKAIHEVAKEFHCAPETTETHYDELKNKIRDLDWIIRTWTKA